MNIKDMIEKLELMEATNLSNDIDFENVYIGDLLSVVMSSAKENSIWITIQTHLNIVAVADLIDIAGIIIVEDMTVDNDTIEKANELEIPILTTDKSAYEIACGIYKLEN
ncbi:MAG: serine kinase [Bacillota bacterium]|nr:serine kinase [Bacillota bacterium]